MELSTVAAILLALVALWAALLVVFWVLRPKDVSVRELLGLIPDILRLLRSLIGDRSAPLDVRLVLIGLVAWIVSPIDLIPEFIPVLGPMDDVVVAIVAMRYVRRASGPTTSDSAGSGSEAGFAMLLTGHRFGPPSPDGT